MRQLKRKLKNWKRVNRMKTTLVTFDNTNNSTIEYIGYYNMLDTIVEQIKECSYEKRIEYIDRYIEIMKLIIELKEKGE